MTGAGPPFFSNDPGNQSGNSSSPFTPPRHAAGKGPNIVGAPPRWNPDEAGGKGSKKSGETAVFDPHNKTEMVGFDMSSLGIKNLSVGLFNFSFITELRLASNRLKSLPTGISSLHCLNFLDISNNLIAELPKEIGWLTELKELLLYNNQLQDLPPEMGFLFQLENLGLDGNPISNEALLSVLHSQGPIAIIPFLRDHMICTLPIIIVFLISFSHYAPNRACLAFH